jgi:hypothetical protein
MGTAREGGRYPAVIHVEPRPEPEDFDRKVRQPGLRALKKPGNLAPLWRECLAQLWEAYGGICAYLAVRIPSGVGARSVDHIVAKSRRPDLAYEWSNFRLVCSLMNARKGVFEDVLDPFEVEDGWFTLELSSLEVLPSPELSPSLKARVESTIDRLKLNDAECVAARAEHYDAYLEHLREPEIGLPFGQLQRWSPFVAMELIRQRIVATRD